MGQVGRIHSGIVLPPLILSLLNQLPVPLSAVLTHSLVSCHSCNICQQRKEKRKLYLQRIQTNGQENIGVGWAAVSPQEAEQCSAVSWGKVPLTSRAVEAAEECRGQRPTVNCLSSPLHLLDFHPLGSGQWNSAIIIFQYVSWSHVKGMDYFTE